MPHFTFYIIWDNMAFHLIAHHNTGIMVLSTVVPTSFVAVDSLVKTRFRFIVGHLRLSLRGTYTVGKGVVLPFDLIADHKTGIVARLLTLWTKQDSGLSWGIFEYRCREHTKGGEGCCIAI
jgi:hypothetical protein